MMKGKIAVMIVALVTIASLIGCAPKVKKPEVKVPVPTKYELEDLYLTTDAKQMTGVAQSSAKLWIDETVVIYARGAMGGKWFELPADVVVSWKADPELEVTPTTGHVVTVNAIKPISVAAYVTATTTTKEGEKIEREFMVMGK